MGNAFYAASQPTQDVLLTHSISGKYTEGGMGEMDSLGSEEIKGGGLYSSQDTLAGGIGLNDNGLAGDDEHCKVCNQARPPQETIIDENKALIWIGCDRCQAWMHAVCVLDKLAKLGITQ